MFRGDTLYPLDTVYIYLVGKKNENDTIRMTEEEKKLFGSLTMKLYAVLTFLSFKCSSISCERCVDVKTKCSRAVVARVLQNDFFCVSFGCCEGVGTSLFKRRALLGTAVSFCFYTSDIKSTFDTLLDNGGLLYQGSRPKCRHPQIELKFGNYYEKCTIRVHAKFAPKKWSKGCFREATQIQMRDQHETFRPSY